MHVYLSWNILFTIFSTSLFSFCNVAWLELMYDGYYNKQIEVPS